MPSTIECEVVEGMMTKELTKLKKQLMVEESVNFPHYFHNKSKFCIFSFIKMFP